MFEMKKKIVELVKRSIFLTIYLIWAFGVTNDLSIVKAAERAVILESVCEKNKVHLFTKGFEKEDEITALVGKNACKISDIAPIVDDGTTIKTLVLVDNSVKSNDDSQALFSEFLESYAADKSSIEQIAISIFGEKITNIIDYTDDYYSLINAIRSLTYGQQSTLLTDVLYEIVDGIASQKDLDYHRIILLTDGVEDEAIGITRDELLDKLKEFPIPIYVLGCKVDGNTNELESVFSLSRKTGAKSYILNDVEKKLEIAEELKTDESIIKVSLVLDIQSLDGSEKTVKLSNGQSSATIDIRMPQAEIKPKQEKPKADPSEKVKGTEKIASDADKASVDANSETEADSIFLGFIRNNWIYFAVGGGVLLILIIVLLILICKKKKDSDSDDRNAFYQMPAPDLDSDATLKVNYAPDVEEGATVHLWENRAAYITLKDINKPEMIFRQMINGSVTIGRSRSKNLLVIDYDKTISGQHCVISIRDGLFYIADSGSSNGTFVNNEKISGEKMIKNNDTITIGQSSYVFMGE